MSLLRNPLVAGGLALALLGAGNWYTGRTKTAHYLGVLAEQDGSEPAIDHSDFRRLTAAMNANLLRPLRNGSGEYQRTHAKIDFYRVTWSGGRLLTLLGFTCLVMGGLLHRRRDSLPSHA